MPRYFFHIDDGELVADPEGIEFPDLAAARSEAVKMSGAMLEDFDGELWTAPKNWAMAVTDEDGHLCFTLRFSAEVPSGPIRYLPDDR